MRLLRAGDVASLVKRIGVGEFLDGLIERLEECFKRWREFRMVPRPSFYYPTGVMEVMPVSDDEYYAVKIVNGHPGNPGRGLLSVVAVGVLAEVETGYPLMIADATLLTALRTAAASAVATKYLARGDSRVLGIVGTGAQSEFQCIAVSRVRPVEEVVYFDLDPRAMEKFEENLGDAGFRLRRAGSAREVAEASDVLVTSTAGRGRRKVVRSEWVRPGTHINAIGGDAPGKTELDPRILEEAKVVVEYLEQARVEGEIQNVGPEAVYAELWEVVTGAKPGRTSRDEITVFDSVGIALEDWAALTYTYELAGELGVGLEVDLLPAPSNPKNLYSLIRV